MMVVGMAAGLVERMVVSLVGPWGRVLVALTAGLLVDCLVV